MDWKNLFFSPEGRIGRQSFWIGWLCLLGAVVVSHWIPFIGLAVLLAAVYGSVCIHTKRLHDMGQTGWWQVLPWVFGPILVFGSLVSIGFSALVAMVNHGEPGLAAIAALGGFFISLFVAFAVWLAFTLWVGCSTGHLGENKYGSEPMRAAVAI